MTLRDYIIEKYDIRSHIKEITRDPVQMILENDIFAYDYFEKDETGRPIKMLYYNDYKSSISVIDLLSFKREDLLKMEDIPLLELWDNYMSQYDFDSTVFEGIIDLKRLREKGVK